MTYFSLNTNSFWESKHVCSNIATNNLPIHSDFIVHTDVFYLHIVSYICIKNYLIDIWCHYYIKRNICTFKPYEIFSFSLTEQTGCDESSSKIVNNGGCAGDQIPKVEVYENSKAAMRASFGHMERPDNSELRPTVETIRDIEKSTHGSTIGKVE